MTQQPDENITPDDAGSQEESQSSIEQAQEKVEQAQRVAQIASQVWSAFTGFISYIVTAIFDPIHWIVGLVITGIFLALLAGISTNQVFGPNPYACQDEIDCQPNVTCEIVAAGVVGGPISPSFSLGSDPKTRRVTLMRELISRLGISPAQAAGILGNLMQESTDEIKPNINQGGAIGPPSSSYTSGHAYGWAQWDADRKKRLVEYGVAQGYVPNKNTDFNDAANLAYLIYELNKFETTSLPALKNAQNARDAARIWREKFERSAAMEESRYTNAEQALREYTAGGSITTPTGSGGGDWVAPVNTPFVITAHWGTYPRGGTHTGVDFDGAIGDPVYAVGAGTAKPAANSWAGPNAVMIDHGNGYWTFYAHMDSTSIKSATPVYAGQQIGTVGNKGNVRSSTGDGSHLHLELGKNGTSPGSSSTLDAEKYLTFFSNPTESIPPPVGGTANLATQACPEQGDNADGMLGGTCDGVPAAYTGPLPHQQSTTTPQMTHTKVQIETNCGVAIPGPLSCPVRTSSIPSSDHERGTACDVFPKGATAGGDACSSQSNPGCANGYKIANWLQQNAGILKIKYLIWDDKIWSQQRASEGWRPYVHQDCSSAASCDNTLQHRDHVHISMMPLP